MDVVLYSSPVKTGSSAALLREMTGESAETVIESKDYAFYNLYEILPQPCIGCSFCGEKCGCVFHDLDKLMRDFETADRVIFAFPVYNLSFPAPMKAVFDRFQRYYNARFIRNEKPPVKKRREAVLLISCGREWERNRDVLMPQLRQAFSVLNLQLTELMIYEKTDTKEGRILRLKTEYEKQ